MDCCTHLHGRHALLDIVVGLSQFLRERLNYLPIDPPLAMVLHHLEDKEVKNRVRWHSFRSIPRNRNWDRG